MAAAPYVLQHLMTSSSSGLAMHCWDHVEWKAQGMVEIMTQPWQPTSTAHTPMDSLLCSLPSMR